MKRYINLGCGIILLLMFQGCASKWDTELYHEYSDATATHDTQQQTAMTNMAKSMAALRMTTTSTADPRDKAMAAMANIMIAQAIADIQYHKSTLVAPTLNTDNVKHVANTISAGIPLFAMWKVSETALENGTGITNVQTAQGDISVSDSLNRTETHATAIDDGTASTSAAASRDEDSSITNPVE